MWRLILVDTTAIRHLQFFVNFFFQLYPELRAVGFTDEIAG